MNEGLIFREKSRSAEMSREKNEFADDSKCRIQFETKDPKITFLNCQLKLERGKKVLKNFCFLLFCNNLETKIEHYFAFVMLDGMKLKVLKKIGFFILIFSY
jgi:hypothetical protein